METLPRSPWFDLRSPSPRLSTPMKKAGLHPMISAENPEFIVLSPKTEYHTKFYQVSRISGFQLM